MLFNEAERHLLTKRRHQVWRTGHARQLKNAAAELERRLELAHHDEDRAFITLRLQELQAKVASFVPTEDQKARALTAPST